MKGGLYDIRQLLPALFLLVIVGFTGFSMAVESPVLWLAAVALVLVNGWSVAAGRFRPIPRWSANLITLAGLAYVVLRVRAGETPILVVGNFLVLLQLVKLFERRANRDVGQLIVLSLLLMVAAAISTPSLAFGLLLATYLILALYTCLLFHLKVETDSARRLMGLSQDRPSDGLRLRQDHRYLGRSMRRLTGLVAAFALAGAVVVFVTFPRGAGAGVLGVPTLRASQAVTGFGGEVGYQDIARITQNRTPVAYVQLIRGGRVVEGTELLYLRGTTVDSYVADPDAADRWTWKRTRGEDREARGGGLGLHRIILEPREPVAPTVVEQRVELEPSGIEVLPAVRGAFEIELSQRVGLTYRPADGTLGLGGRQVTRKWGYRVWSDNASPGMLPANFLRQTPPASPGLVAFAEDPDVVGRADDGTSLTQVRRDLAATGRTDAELDVRIARNIERYLQTQYNYTLDVTDARISQLQDPLEWFVSEGGRRGHCEYFAGAMTLACQVIGIPARIVVGFMSDEYNVSMGKYVVRQSHAHTWVEVWTGDGWQAFDPTSGRDEDGNGTSPGLVNRLRHLMEFLEYSWANNVVAFDNTARESIIQNLEASMVNSAGSGADWGSTTWQDLQDRLNAWLRDQNLYFLSATLISWLIGIMLSAGAVLTFVFVFQKWKLRRRARRIGLDHLPPNQRRRLARQLGFYDQMLRTLERHGYRRRPSQTPLEFARSLVSLPADAYNAVCTLTDVFYDVRYGHARLHAGRRKRLDRAVVQLESTLGT